MHNNISKSLKVLTTEVRRIIASKLRRWKLKDNWPSEVTTVLRQWSYFAIDFDTCDDFG